MITGQKLKKTQVGVALIRRIAGRKDVYPRRFESRRTGKTGYQPACGNEWIKGFVKSPKLNAANVKTASFFP